MRGLEGEVREGLRGGVDQGDERRSLRSRLMRHVSDKRNGRGIPGRFNSASGLDEIYCAVLASTRSLAASRP